MKDLVLLPGALGASAEFADLIPLLSRDYTVHLYDYPGHGGRSTVPANELSIALLTADLLDWLQERNLNSASFFGYSMGGYVALYLSHLQPKKVEGIATLGTKFNWSPEIAEAKTRKLNPEVLQSKVPQFAQALSERHGDRTWEAVVSGTAILMRQLGEAPVLTEKLLGEVNCPVLLGIGDRDRMVTLEETLNAFQLIQGAQLAVLPATPHAWEKAPLDLVGTILKRFF